MPAKFVWSTIAERFRCLTKVPQTRCLANIVLPTSIRNSQQFSPCCLHLSPPLFAKLVLGSTDGCRDSGASTFVTYLARATAVTAVATIYHGLVHPNGLHNNNGAMLCEEKQSPESIVSTSPQVGEWRLDRSQSDSMRSYLMALGVPGFAARFVDAVPVDLCIKRDGALLQVTDRTFFGNNTTVVQLGGPEIKKATRNKRKHFMLSAFEEEDPHGVTRLTVCCRLYERGDGWRSLQSWALLEDSEHLQERYVLQRPNDDDVVVNRVFRRIEGSQSINDRHGAVTSATSETSVAGSSAMRTVMISAGGLACLTILACAGFLPGFTRPKN